jgi:ATP adenylyltransferase
MKTLAAPWRWDFISTVKSIKGCIFCQAQLAEDAPDSLFCHRGKKFFVLLNKYPYNTGHLMIAPLAHLHSPDQVLPEDSVEMWQLLNRSLEILRRRFNPDGFNIGFNIGAAAGAGIKDHFHLHIVPRWQGDANFMPVIGGTRVMSYDLHEVCRIVREEFAHSAEAQGEPVP